MKFEMQSVVHCVFISCVLVHVTVCRNDGKPPSASSAMEFRVVSPDGSPDANDTEVCEDLHRAHSTHSMLNLSSPLLDDTGHKTPVTLNSRLVENYLTNLIEIWRSRIPKHVTSRGFREISQDVRRYCFTGTAFETHSITTQHGRSPQLDMSILVVNGCIATLLNREILIENYWDENEDVCYRQYKDELKTFMRSYVKPLSMSIDQLIAFYIRHQPRIYHPVCRQMIRKNELIPVSWPPEHASRSGDDDSLIRPHQLDVLSLFSTYTQFVSFIRSYLAR